MSVVGSALRNRYKGEVTDSQVRHGRGRYDFGNGFSYEGEWSHGKREGHGSFTIGDGSAYVGEWSNDEMTGKGVRTWPSGKRYEGQFCEGEFNGYGKLSLPGGETYEGEFRGNKRHGAGKVIRSDGSGYVGEFADNVIEGKGTLTTAEGAVLTGSFVDGKLHGSGEMSTAEHYTFTGNFDSGVPMGRGEACWANGVSFTGEFREGQPIGGPTSVCMRPTAPAVETVTATAEAEGGGGGGGGSESNQQPERNQTVVEVVPEALSLRCGRGEHIFNHEIVIVAEEDIPPPVGEEVAEESKQGKAGKAANERDTAKTRLVVASFESGRRIQVSLSLLTKKGEEPAPAITLGDVRTTHGLGGGDLFSIPQDIAPGEYILTLSDVTEASYCALVTPLNGFSCSITIDEKTVSPLEDGSGGGGGGGGGEDTNE